MSSLKILLVWGLVCLGSPGVAGQSNGLSVAEQMLGPRWKQVARTAGLIFAGTVVRVESPSFEGAAVPTISVHFKVNRAIAGVRSGQELTIREWAGAWRMHRPMRTGDRVLLFLYPPSRLRLTSPVSGSSGQVALDATGAYLASRNFSRPSYGGNLMPEKKVAVSDLERAIRSARED